MLNFTGNIEKLFAGQQFASQPEEGFMTRLENPAKGFDPFRVGDAYVRWIASPSDIGSHIGARLEKVWSNALGVTLVADPKLDAYGAIFHHSAYKNTTWSPYIDEHQRWAWQGLGGIMAYEHVTPGKLETGLFLENAGVTEENLNPSEQADMQFLEAMLRVAGKGMAMTPKWRFIEEALVTSDIPGAKEFRELASRDPDAMSNFVGLGGMKSIVIHHKGDEAKTRAIQMMASAARVIGMYVSGGDENTSRGPWTDIFAQTAPYNMAGSLEADPMLRGRIPNEHTAAGVHMGIMTVLRGMKDEIGSKGILYQGYGGVGGYAVDFARRDGLNVAGVIEASLDELLKAKRDLAGTDVSLIWDAAPSRKKQDFHELRSRAIAEGFAIVDGLADAVRWMGNNKDIGIVSPNAVPKTITEEVLKALHQNGVKAVVGGANNVLALDVEGSYLTLARMAVDLGIFVPNDSAINRGGATAVLWNALGFRESSMQRVVTAIGDRVSEELYQFKRGVSPQVYSDEFAQRKHNRMIDLGHARGGRFPVSSLTAGIRRPTNLLFRGR